MQVAWNQKNRSIASDVESKTQVEFTCNRKMGLQNQDASNVESNTQIEFTVDLENQDASDVESINLLVSKSKIQMT